MKKLVIDDWISPEGYRCIVRFHEKAGHRTGYIFIPDSSRAYVEPVYETLKILEKEITVMTYSEMYNIEVHGGLTYGVQNTPGVTYPGEDPRDGTWLGFDAAHCDDKPDFDVWETLIEDDADKELVTTLKDIETKVWGRKGSIDDRVMRTSEFMKEQCELMSRQVYIMDKGKPDEQE